MSKPRRYTGWSRWAYSLKGKEGYPDGYVTMDTPTGNFREDEGFARDQVRKKIGLERLPAGALVWPAYPPSS